MRISRLIGLAIMASGMCLTTVQAQAISRYDPARMSCGAIQDRVAREGAVILRYTSKRNLPVYDRYVVNNRFCPAGQVRERAYVPSTDARSCPVYRCVQPQFERRGRIWRFGH